MDGISQPFGSKLSAGDRWKWTVALENFPASDWRLTYSFRGNPPTGGKLDVVSTASGNDHLLSALPAATGALLPGSYGWQAVVEQIADATEHYELGRGTVEILPNLQKAGADGTQDFRSQNRRILDLIRKAIEGTASREEMEYELEGRKVSFWGGTKLLEFEGVYAARVRREEIEAGNIKANSNAVHVRFGCTR